MSELSSSDFRFAWGRVKRDYHGKGVLLPEVQNPKTSFPPTINAGNEPQGKEQLHNLTAAKSGAGLKGGIPSPNTITIK